MLATIGIPIRRHLYSEWNRSLESMKLGFRIFISYMLSREYHLVRERERLSLSAFLRTEDIEVHIVHISRVIITYTLEYTIWWEINIHSSYSLVKITIAPIYTCKNNRRIWRHNDSISHHRCGDVTMLSQKRSSLATIVKCVINDFFSKIVCSGHRIACKK